MARLVSLVNAIPAPLAARLTTNALATRLVRPLVNRLVPPEAVAVVVRSGEAAGLRLLVDLKREKYYAMGTHEAVAQEAVARLLRPGLTFWDVGAHVGFFTLLGRRLVGARGAVHAFEPMPANRNRLEQSLRMNGFDDVRVHRCAIGGRAGRLTLHPHSSTSMWTLIEEYAERTAAGIEVTCETLDGLAARVGEPDLIKIDVEGAELDVLDGGTQLLERRRPAVVVEFSTEERLQGARALLPHYRFERIGRYHWVLT